MNTTYTPTTGDLVDYVGSVTEAHGTYRVIGFNPYTGRFNLTGVGPRTAYALVEVSPRSIRPHL